MTTFTIPWWADPGTVPSKLPSVQEINLVQNILSNQTARKMVTIGQHFVVKYGLAVDLLEGKTMLFLQWTTTSIPIPRIYALFQDPKTKVNYIIMERINGKSLDSEWPKLGNAAKEAIASKLRLIFEQIRNVESPAGYCSLDCRGLTDGIFWTGDDAKPFAGPFGTESEFNAAIIGKCRESMLPKHKADFYTQVFASLLKGHPPVLTHGDFQRKNIMIRGPFNPEEDAEAVGKSELDLVLVDWEFAGWSPSYWEYCLHQHGIYRAVVLNR
jgi:hypothetical protein